MWLTKNEKSIIKLLLANSRLSDSSIAEKLKISSQAVGRIRKKLEKGIIQGYTLKLDFSKLGINVFMICKAKITSNGEEYVEKNVENKIKEDSNIITLSQLVGGEFSYLILAGFKDLQDLERFFHSEKRKESIHKYLVYGDMIPISAKSILKHDPQDLWSKSIDELGT